MKGNRRPPLRQGPENSAAQVPTRRLLRAIGLIDDEVDFAVTAESFERLAALRQERTTDSHLRPSESRSPPRNPSEPSPPGPPPKAHEERLEHIIRLMAHQDPRCRLLSRHLLYGFMAESARACREAAHTPIGINIHDPQRDPKSRAEPAARVGIAVCALTKMMMDVHRADAGARILPPRDRPPQHEECRRVRPPAQRDEDRLSRFAPDPRCKILGDERRKWVPASLQQQ